MPLCGALRNTGVGRVIMQTAITDGCQANAADPSLAGKGPQRPARSLRNRHWVFIEISVAWLHGTYIGGHEVLSQPQALWCHSELKRGQREPSATNWRRRAPQVPWNPKLENRHVPLAPWLCHWIQVIRDPLGNQGSLRGLSIDQDPIR